VTASAQAIKSRGYELRHGLVLAVVLGNGLSSAPAEAQTAPASDARRVVLVLTDTPGDSFLAKIKAEITSLGLDVIVRAPQGSMEESARAAHAVAAIQMLPSRKGIEVWMADAASGRSLLRQRIVDETAGGPNQTVVALQTAELLRTSLFPHPPRETPKPEVAPPVRVVVRSAPPPAFGESGVSGRLGLLYGAGGSTPSWQAGLSYRYLWKGHFGGALTVSAPILRGSMSGTEGSADVGALVAGGEVVARFHAKDGRFAFTPALGAAYVTVLARGHANSAVGTQLVSSASTGHTGLGYACASAEWKLSRWFGLGINGLAGATVSRVSVRFAGNDAGAWGTLVLGTSVFGEVSWW
jgi:hypothetical protein